MSIPMMISSGVFTGLILVAVLILFATLLGAAARSRRTGDSENNPLSVPANLFSPPPADHVQQTSPLLLYEMYEAATPHHTDASPTTHPSATSSAATGHLSP